MSSILKYSYLYLFFLSCIFCRQINAQIQKGSTFHSYTEGDQLGSSISMPNENTIAIGSNNFGETNRGCVQVYTWNGSQWIEKGNKIFGVNNHGWAGTSVHMPDENTLALGEPYSNYGGDNRGNVRIFNWVDNQWIQKGQTIIGVEDHVQAGWGVSMPNPNTVAIGTEYSRYIRVYDWNGSDWTARGGIITGEDKLEYSFSSICMPDANTLAVGTPHEATNEEDLNDQDIGMVRVFSWDGENWIQKGATFTGESHSHLGYGISMSDANTIAIGAYEYSGTYEKNGHAKVFLWDGESWIQKGSDIEGIREYERFGFVLSLYDENTIAISNKSITENSLVRLYAWNGNSWVQQGYTIHGEHIGDNFGTPLVMPNKQTIGIAASRNSNIEIIAGVVKVYNIRGVQGLVYNNFDQSCSAEGNPVLEGIQGIIQPSGHIVTTQSNGYWHVDSLPQGNYTLTFDTTNNWIPSCGLHSLSFEVTDPNELKKVADFGMHNTTQCPAPHTSIFMPFMRPGFSNQHIYVQACNSNVGSDILTNTTIVVTLDDLLTLDSASLNYSSLENNSFSFEIGDLQPGDCVNFTLSSTLSTQAVLNQTLCLESTLIPVEPCSLDSTILTEVTHCTTSWDKSSLNVEGACINDTIIFIITNTGLPDEGDMTCYSPIRLYIDGEFIWSDSIQLQGGESITLQYSGDGRTWRLEADQHPLHPGNSSPNASVERCGNDANWTSNMINQLPHDDLDPIKDIYCGIVTGSYDPNDKTGFPLGLGDDHRIMPNGKMEYLIRFQNTGTDTAFTVVIRDTLSSNLDIFSVESGVASFPYSFKSYGPRILEWTFTNIKLPDSTTNEPNSHGFVTFTVNQINDLPDDTEINNVVGIYFDYNEPIITNTTSHIIDRRIYATDSRENLYLSVESCNHYEINNITYTQSGNYYQLIKGGNTDTLLTLDLIVNHISDLSLFSNDSLVILNNANAIYNWLDCDNNFSKIEGETNQYYYPTKNGFYAAEITENGCTDTTECIQFDGISISGANQVNNFILFPNPTDGNIQIYFDQEQENVGISLFNIQGQLIQKSSFTETQEITLEFNDNSSSIYILEVQTINRKSIRKIIKK